MGRISKQLLYGFGFLLILSALGFWIYFANFRTPPTCFDNVLNQDETQIDCGGGCIDCELKGLELEISDVQLLPAENNQLTFMVRVLNPSKNYSANFTYQLEVFGSFGERLAVVDGSSTVGPGDARFIIAPGVTFNIDDFSGAEFNIAGFEWQNASETKAYNVQIENIETIVDGGEVRVVGTVVNNDSLSLEKVRINAFIFDSFGGLLNASAVDVNNIGSFKTSDFTVFFPKIEGITLNLDKSKTLSSFEVINKE